MRENPQFWTSIFKPGSFSKIWQNSVEFRSTTTVWIKKMWKLGRWVKMHYVILTQFWTSKFTKFWAC